MKQLMIALFIFNLLLSGCSTGEKPDIPTNAPATETSLDKARSAGDIVEYQKLDVKPVMVKQVNPTYPEGAEKFGMEGNTLLRLLVNETGNITRAEILKSSGHQQMDEAAVAAAEKFEFTPGKVNGEPVKVWMTIPFKFKLK